MSGGGGRAAAAMAADAAADAAAAAALFEDGAAKRRRRDDDDDGQGGKGSPANSSSDDGSRAASEGSTKVPSSSFNSSASGDDTAADRSREGGGSRGDESASTDDGDSRRGGGDGGEGDGSPPGGRPTPSLDEAMPDAPSFSYTPPPAPRAARLALPPLAAHAPPSHAHRPDGPAAAAAADRALRSPDLAPYIPSSLAAAAARAAAGERPLMHVASFTNLHVATPLDALVLIQACRMGIGKSIEKRLTPEQRKGAVASGTVFVFEEGGSGIKRWTDGRRWTPSRVNGLFLVYREVDSQSTPSQGGKGSQRGSHAKGSRADSVGPSDDGSPAATPGPDGSGGKPSRSDAFNYLLTNGLVKKAMSVPGALRPPKVVQPPADPAAKSYHLVHYFRPRDVTEGRLKQPSQLQAFDEIKSFAIEWGKTCGMLGDDQNAAQQLELDNEDFAAAKAAGAPTRRRPPEGNSGAARPAGPFAVPAPPQAERHHHHHRPHQHNLLRGLGADPARFANSPAPTNPGAMQSRPRAHSMHLPPTRADYQYAGLDPVVGFLDGRFGMDYMPRPEVAYGPGAFGMHGHAPYDHGFDAYGSPGAQAEAVGDAAMPPATSPLTQLATYFDNTLLSSPMPAPPLPPPSIGGSGGSPGSPPWTADHLGRPMMQPYANFPPMDAMDAKSPPDASMSPAPPAPAAQAGKQPSFFPDLITDNDPMLASASRPKRTITEVEVASSGSGSESDGERERRAQAALDEMDTAVWGEAGKLFPQGYAFEHPAGHGRHAEAMEAEAIPGPSYDWFMTNFAATAAEAAALMQARAPGAVAAIPGVKRSPPLGDTLEPPGAPGRSGGGGSGRSGGPAGMSVPGLHSLLGISRHHVSKSRKQG